MYSAVDRYYFFLCLKIRYRNCNRARDHYLSTVLYKLSRPVLIRRPFFGFAVFQIYNHVGQFVRARSERVWRRQDLFKRRLARGKLWRRGRGSRFHEVTNTDDRRRLPAEEGW